jgi:HK97 family phage portal protein
MNIFTTFFKRKNKIFNRDMSGLYKVFNNASSFTAGKNSTVFSAMDMICCGFANLNGYFFNKESKQILHEHPLYEAVNYPNADETKFQFFYNSAVDYFNGNVFWFLSYNEEGNLVSLFRLNPSRVIVKRDFENKKIFLHNGVEYDGKRILHIPSRFGYNGLAGKSIFNECSAVFANTAEIDEYVNNSFNNSVGNRLIIDISKEYPNATDERIDELKKLFTQNYTGIKNAAKPLIKSGKINYEKIETDTKDNRANQLVENRNFQETEIAKLFGIPLALLKGTETNNIENLYTIFIENAIRPIAVSFEQSINKLIPPRERNYVYFEYSYNSLMKTSLQTRIDSYQKQINNGILTVNEVRRKENLPEDEAGNILLVSANLMPLTKEIIDSYMASAKIKNQELNTNSPDTIGEHSNLGDDKV